MNLRTTIRVALVAAVMVGDAAYGCRIPDVDARAMQDDTIR